MPAPLALPGVPLSFRPVAPSRGPLPPHTHTWTLGGLRGGPAHPQLSGPHLGPAPALGDRAHTAACSEPGGPSVPQHEGHAGSRQKSRSASARVSIPPGHVLPHSASQSRRRPGPEPNGPQREATLPRHPPQRCRPVASSRGPLPTGRDERQAPGIQESEVETSAGRGGSPLWLLRRPAPWSCQQGVSS